MVFLFDVVCSYGGVFFRWWGYFRRGGVFSEPREFGWVGCIWFSFFVGASGGGFLVVVYWADLRGSELLHACIILDPKTICYSQTKNSECLRKTTQKI